MNLLDFGKRSGRGRVKVHAQSGRRVEGSATIKVKRNSKLWCSGEDEAPRKGCARCRTSFIPDQN